MISSHYQTEINEVFTMLEVQYHEVDELNHLTQGSFCIVWNVGEPAAFHIDNQLVTIKQNCVLFLTEANVIEHTKFTTLRIMHFNHAFFCKDQKHSELGCQGVLFFGSANIPKISLTNEMLSFCEWTWNWLFEELQNRDAYKLPVLQSTIDLIIAVSTRAFKVQNIEFISTNFEVDIIKEYHFLIEKHYKTITTVEAYAKMLHISPKSLSNLFKKYDNRTPFEIIKERRQLQAVRLLKHTSKSISKIAEELSFTDIYTFSRFFKTNTGISPSHYRKKIKQLTK
ncbi:helix-turn-helix transcriptional regulator [Aquimarina sp. TRL1]|uniref:helix-turn-helix domain-containing protein n=1 Tax=Aquimarina sp. (strain TRL1) TaxID=2736252 RepID=UPI001589E141|nr:AraC family transcriptional regulator [Aquimarina sp. TRL1]QKX06170.1 helix-turn-helix transcriptional regulator [Aquimarina sp. TRL1]